MNKWIGISLGSLLGITHIGMIGLIATNKNTKLPSLDIPVGDYTSYVVSADKDGYKISYSANDPKPAFITKDIKEKGGFLGLANETTKVTEEYFMDGQINQGGPVSNHRSWIDTPSGLSQEEAARITEIRKSEKAFLIGVLHGKQNAEVVKEHLSELKQLAETAGAKVVGEITQNLRKINPQYFIGKGKARQIIEQAKTMDVELIIFDDELSIMPSHLR